ncbi:hypothetical protein GMORB2_0012 [Geosmithia morbida]|uniref:Uncharacterized protein n=1 Tax=Geosmithia morbida TaxID=1094350 RepID=A0A9P4Z061_9HYPO|nr:uncharacterized protein GMORB2_0012 [Geosmithia morbida]KAF4126276.1 hypothetical protein GMORB2_0012 [Geosmithia morbida]
MRWRGLSNRPRTRTAVSLVSHLLNPASPYGPRPSSSTSWPPSPTRGVSGRLDAVRVPLGRTGLEPPLLEPTFHLLGETYVPYEGLHTPGCGRAAPRLGRVGGVARDGAGAASPPEAQVPVRRRDNLPRGAGLRCNAENAVTAVAMSGRNFTFHKAVTAKEDASTSTSRRRARLSWTLPDGICLGADEAPFVAGSASDVQGTTNAGTRVV